PVSGANLEGRDQEAEAILRVTREKAQHFARCAKAPAAPAPVLVRLHRRRRSRLIPALPVADHRRAHVELPAQLRDRLLAAQDSMDRLPLELRGEHAPSIRLAWKITHGPSFRDILRSMGAQSNRGALQTSMRMPLLHRAVR